jgi:two-component system, sensor histidine kinase
MKLFHGSIRKKLIVLVLLATMPVFLVLLGTELLNRNNAVEFAEKDTALYLTGFAEIQRRTTNSTQTLLRTVASIPDISSLDVEKSRVILTTLLDTNPIYTNVILVDLKGNVVAAGKNHDRAKKLNFGDRKQFRDAIASKGFASGEFVVGKSSKKAIFPFGMAVQNKQGELVGAIIIGVNLTHYSELFQKGDYPQDTFFGLCDRNGIRLLRYPITEKSAIGKSIKKKVYEAASTNGEKGSVSALASDGKKRVIAFEPLRLTEDGDIYMYMFMGFDSEQLQKEAHSILYRLLVTSFISLALALFITWFIGGRSIAQLIEKLSLITRKVSQGEKNVTSHIDYSDGEIGDLAHSFDNMVKIIRQREEELETSEQRFREIIEDVSAISIQGYDKERKITFWNQASETLYGYSKAEALGAQLDDLIIPKAMQGRLKELHTKWLEDGIKMLSTEHLLVDKNGKDIPVFSSHVMLEAQSGKEIFNLDIDLTPIRAAEEEKNKLVSQLNQAQKMDAIGQLAGGVAHDFNNMLGAILNAGELLTKYLPEHPKAIRYHRLIVQSAKRAADLTGKLLAFSRTTNKASATVDIHDIINETIIILKNTIDRRIKIETDLRAIPSSIKGDASQLQSALLNLGINGSQAISDGGTLQFSSNLIEIDSIFCEQSLFDLQPGKYLKIKVRDTGCGIPVENRNKIFDPFFTTKEQGKGTGLGLTAVYGTIKQHKGSISVCSELNVGTTFDILLPLDEKGVTAGILPQAILKGTGTILVVDDEESMRVTASAILKDLGYTILQAENGKEAVSIFKKNQESIDLVLLDMMMPVMNGKDCFIALQQLNPQICVLLSSGYILNEDLEEMKNRGLKGFIRKPYLSGPLSQAIHEARC